MDLRSAVGSATLKTFIAISAAHALGDCLGGVWPMFKMLAGVDLAAAGVITTVATIAGTMMQPVFGHWADRGHQRTCIVLGTWLTAMVLLFGPMARYLDLNHPLVWVALCVVLLLIRTGQGMYHPAGASLAGSTSAGRRSTLVSIYIMCGMTGFSLSHLTFSWVYVKLDRELEWLIIPVGLIMLAVMVWCRPRENHHEDRPSIGAMLSRIWELRGKLFELYIVLSLVSGIGFGFIFIMPELARDFGYSNWIVKGGGHVMLVFGSAIVIIPVGMIADRVGRKRVLIITLAMGIGLFYFLLLTPWVTGRQFLEWEFLVLLFLTGGFTGCPNPLGVAHGQALDPKHQSMITGVLMGLAWALGAVIPTIVGFVAKQQEYGPVDALIWTGLGYFVALWLAFWIPRTPRETAAA